MPYSPPTIPEIFVSPAPPQKPIAEPYSPFASIKYPIKDDGFRPRLLTPPPSSPLRTHSSSSPSSGGYNSDEERFDYNEGLDRQHFEALLQATRERNAGRAPDLRREVTLRAHQTKQFERRARFITRVLAGPLNSFVPGLLAPPTVPLSSPVAVAHRKETCSDIDTAQSAARGNTVPSLEEIGARLASQGYICIPLSKQRMASGQQTADVESSAILTRQSSPSMAQLPSLGNMQIQAPRPRTSNQLVSSADNAGPVRVSRAQDMLSALRRRTSPPINATEGSNVDDKKKKRHSAPGDLFPLQERADFQHPVLSVPGGF